MNLNNELRKDLRTPGAITQMALEKKGVKSPSTSNKVEIAKGFWIVPRTPIKNEAERIKFISEKRLKYGLL